MYCSNCGYNVGNDSNFCPVCGKPVQKIDINLNKENTQHEFTQENDTSHENMREVYMRQDYDYSEGSYEGYNGDDSSDDVMEGAASGTRWYDRKRLYTPLIVLTLVHVFITVLFLFNAVGSLKYKAIWLILIVSIACFGEYYLDWRFERRIRHYINIVGNILVIIVCALGFIWVCSAQHNVINCVQSNDFLDGTQTIGEKFDDFFDDVSWYNVEALSDGGVLVQVKGTCGKGDFKHTVDIKFAYLGVNMSDVDEDSELTWGVVSLDGKMLDNEEVYELFGLDNYSGNYSKTDSQNEKDASKTDSDNGKDASKTDKEDKDRFEHDIYLAKKSGKEFSSLNYEDAFNRIFDNSEWRAYDGISYSPDVNGDGISDYSMSNRDIVEFSGECNYIDEDVTMLFQFLMFSQDRYSPVYLEIDGVAQSKAILDEVMDELMFPEKYAVDDEENYDPQNSDESIWKFPCGVFGNNEDSQAKVSIEYIGGNQYSVDIDIYGVASLQDLVGYSNDGIELMVEATDSAGDYISLYFPAITNGEMIFYVEKSSLEYLSEGDVFLVYMYP